MIVADFNAVIEEGGGQVVLHVFDILISSM